MYKARRDGVRATWLADRAAWDDRGVAAAFVIGSHRLAARYFPAFSARHSPTGRSGTGGSRGSAAASDADGDGDAAAALDAELSNHGDIVFLPADDVYKELPRKTLLYFTYVFETYDADVAVKVDDDVWVNLSHLQQAVPVWAGANADYIGCMMANAVFSDPRQKWFEPAHHLFPGHYPRHASGSMYILSRRALTLLAGMPRGASGLRMLANEDTSLGMWMLALNVNHYHEMRLCASDCADAIGWFDTVRPTPEDPVAEMVRVHALCADGEADKAKREDAVMRTQLA